MAEDPQSNSSINGQDNPSNQAPAKKSWNTPSGRHPGGRPTKYKRIYCNLLLQYFDIQPCKESLIIKSGKNWRVEETKLLPVDFPTFEGFSWNIGVTPQILYDWGNEHPEFQQALTRVRAKQRDILVRGGLNGVYEARTVNLVGINFCGMSNRIEIDASIGAGERLTDERVRQIAQEAARAQLKGVIDVPRITAKTEEG